MTIGNFAAIGHLAALTRRRSLGLVGGSVLAGLLTKPAPIRAARQRKKSGSRCRRPRAQCVAAITEYCATVTNPALCESVYLPCCDHFDGCNIEAGIACLFAAD